MDMYEYKTQAGETIHLPPMKSVKSGVLRKHRADTEIDFMYAILESLVDEENLAKVDDLEVSEVETLFSGWQAHNGATVGESSGSST